MLLVGKTFLFVKKKIAKLIVLFPSGIEHLPELLKDMLTTIRELDLVVQSEYKNFFMIL